jgi:nicotinate-nucleotide adenylyltransferase
VRVKVAVYGGSFDPPHVSHVLAVAYAFAMGGFERVLVVPVFAHAFGKSLAPFDDRLAMTRLAMRGLSFADVSDVERELGTPSYTWKTLQHLHALHPDWELRLVVGSDVLLESSKWERFDDVVRLAPLFVLGRAGIPHPNAPPSALPEVSSTHIRAMLAERSDDDELRRWVPPSVLEYLDARGLYRAGTGTSPKQ